eukprot:CAMPEP_0170610692 /NCGR_PEP_ID=MMETSP0224-20130122/22796_1 /TAXON_ID=285029 /ORGANISM="Togula jolla, Strain CCCM 725" /LENGTH=199 /DNA_ID=CAMNT_0010936087 /DNA_START=15 /DNA_END=614 /DNA_ORIENTATION=+
MSDTVVAEPFVEVKQLSTGGPWTHLPADRCLPEEVFSTQPELQSHVQAPCTEEESSHSVTAPALPTKRSSYERQVSPMNSTSSTADFASSSDAAGLLSITPSETLSEVSVGMVEIELRRFRNRKIGLDVGRDGENTLRILKVHEGLVSDWNKTRAEIEGKPQIEKGFRIMEVNGISRDPVKMIETFQSSTSLKIILKPH